MGSNNQETTKKDKLWLLSQRLNRLPAVEPAIGTSS